MNQYENEKIRQKNNSVIDFEFFYTLKYVVDKSIQHNMSFNDICDILWDIDGACLLNKKSREYVNAKIAVTAISPRKDV